LPARRLKDWIGLEEAKYTRVEYERRFLVAPEAEWRDQVETYRKTFDDKYLRGTRLRLRFTTNSYSDEGLIKLTKKAESPSPYFQTISRILLSRDEYEFLARLEGDKLRKVRHYHRTAGRVFSIDVFEGELEGLILCETEAEALNDLMLAEPPSFVKQEVTEDLFFTGGSLCKVTRIELMNKLTGLMRV